jgi:Mn2+/Fe2+ NRAMP family transporter
MNILNKLGPGFLYAAAAIGVSHLVQSTRAGAMFGPALILMVIAANLIKMPTFQIAARYTSSTGKTLLEGYRELGVFALVIFYILTFMTMFTIQSAVTIVTAGIGSSILGLDFDPRWMAIIILTICSAILIIGHYSILDKLVKYIVILLTITTSLSLVFALTADFPTPAPAVNFDFSNKAHLFFLVALVGWMPAPLDISIWHSLWLKAKMRLGPVEYSESQFDFKIGYIGTMILAVGFLCLGWLVMYRSGIQFSNKSAVFASQLIDLYTKSLGSWSYPLIALAAFSTMFSTTLTCLDAFPRCLRKATQLTLGTEKNHETVYNIWLIVTVIGTSIFLFFFMENMKAMVDLATTLSFITAPAFAILNILVMNRKDVPEHASPSRNYNIISWICASILTVFAIYFLVIKFT